MSDRLEEILSAVATIVPKSTPRLVAYRQGAVNRKLSFELSDEEAQALFRSPCRYCGYLPKHGFNGIDRVNNALGYTKENAVACCQWCNRAKGRYGLEAFMEWLRWVQHSSVGAVKEPVEVNEPKGVEWSAPTFPEPLRYPALPYDSDPEARRLDLGGLTPQEYVRKAIWGSIHGKYIHNAERLAANPRSRKRR